jgi:hypothetical protein
MERGKPLERETQTFGRGASHTVNEPSVGEKYFGISQIDDYYLLHRPGM